jgi:BirA family biotin operon repressor/biotin-[acetyl-CoA-carboxylase] ligase
MPPLDGTRLRDALRDDPFTREIVILESTGSTNDDALRLVASGSPQGTVVVASVQTAGRGRLARRWHSAPGVGLYLSVVLRPSGPVEELTRWTVGSSLAACLACRAFSGCDVEIEWPNDLLTGGRKVAGTLAEARSMGGRTTGLVLGTGFNVNHETEDFPPELRESATSLRLACGGRVALARESLAAEYLRRLGGVASRLERGEWESVAAEWSRHAPSASGRRVVVVSSVPGSTERIRGTTAGLDEHGALRVERADGSGTIRVRMSDAVVPAEA